MIEEIKVSQRVQDGPYGWPVNYRVIVDPQKVTVNIRVQFQPGTGTTSDDLTTVQRETSKAVSRYYDQKFGVRDEGGRDRNVHVKVEFVDFDPDLNVTVHAGAGRDNLRHWFVTSGTLARAHEFGHALGLKDEYVDPLVAGRSTKGSPEVCRDHSLFGNFHDEGAERAELKPRHANFLAQAWGEALGKRFEVTPETGIGQARPGLSESSKFTFEQLRALVAGQGSGPPSNQRLNTGVKI